MWGSVLFHYEMEQTEQVEHIDKQVINVFILSLYLKFYFQILT